MIVYNVYEIILFLFFEEYISMYYSLFLLKLVNILRNNNHYLIPKEFLNFDKVKLSNE